MPESPRMVPVYLARIADLRVGARVSVRCASCGHTAELAAMVLRERLSLDLLVKRLGPQFRCRNCGHKGARVNAKEALGYYG
ncbi:MAG TPA: hypothetical protein VFA50_22540 [Stellaceae bacterium]|nr:hypothetical protein [Stellaceae bacterium]